MNVKSTLLQAGAIAALALLSISCTQSGEDGAALERPLIAAPGDFGQSRENEESADPLTRLKLSNGNELEFYDFNSSLMVVESGVAGATSGLPKDFKKDFLEKKFASPGDRLLAIWDRLAPQTSVPETFKSFHLRWKNRPANAATRVRVPPLPELSAEPSKTVIPLAKTADNCNNGCCHFPWLSTFGACQADWDVSWFFFDEFATRANVNDVEILMTMVCSAVGTSTWRISIGSSNKVFSVPQATFRQFNWVTGWFDEDLTSSTNSATTPHLHTYCGDAYK